jgi:hypothetical protein
MAWNLRWKKEKEKEKKKDRDREREVGKINFEDILFPLPFRLQPVKTNVLSGRCLTRFNNRNLDSTFETANLIPSYHDPTIYRLVKHRLALHLHMLDFRRPYTLLSLFE